MKTAKPFLFIFLLLVFSALAMVLMAQDEATKAFKRFESCLEAKDFDRAHLFLRLAILRSDGKLRFVERYRDSVLERGCRPQDCAEFAAVIQQLLLKVPMEQVETYLFYVEELERQMPDVDGEPDSESGDTPLLSPPSLDVRSVFDPDNGQRILEDGLNQLLSGGVEVKDRELERWRTALSLHGLFMACRENLVRAESAARKASADHPGVEELFHRLSSQEIAAPLAGAQQQVGAMFLFPVELFSEKEQSVLLEGIHRQESRLLGIAGDMDKDRWAAIQSELERLDADISGTNSSLTEQIAVLKTEIDFIATHIPSIGTAGIAEQILAAQSNRVERLHDMTVQRHAAYQTWAMDELKKAISAQDLDKKDGSEKYEKAKAALLNYLARIDRSLLVPEVHEIYQDVYRRALETITKHLEDKGKRREKADFLLEFYTKPKKGLEDF